MVYCYGYGGFLVVYDPFSVAVNGKVQLNAQATYGDGSVDNFTSSSSWSSNNTSVATVGASGVAQRYAYCAFRCVSSWEITLAKGDTGPIMGAMARRRSLVVPTVGFLSPAACCPGGGFSPEQPRATSPCHQGPRRGDCLRGPLAPLMRVGMPRIPACDSHPTL